MSPQDFAYWLEGLLSGDDEQRARLARPTITTGAQEVINGEIRPAVVVCFPGGTFILAVAKAGS
jgi:hypothetical protein